MARTEWIAIVKIIINPPWIVSRVGCSFITIHTHIGPNIVSSKKNRLTSAAVINLGAMVTNTNGIATQRMHIAGTIIKSLLDSSKLSTKKNAIIATNNFPTTAEELDFYF